jgi:hypothetical protein
VLLIARPPSVQKLLAIERAFDSVENRLNVPVGQLKRIEPPLEFGQFLLMLSLQLLVRLVFVGTSDCALGEECGDGQGRAWRFWHDAFLWLMSSIFSPNGTKPR